MLHPDTTTHLQQARDYIRNISSQGIDTSALFISQAYLTNLQTALRPSQALESLFSKEDLTSLVEITSNDEDSSSPTGYNQRIICGPLLKYFKITSIQEIGQPCDHSPSQVSLLMGRILDSLEEWDIICKKANKMSVKLDGYRSRRKQAQQLRKLGSNLEDFLDMILKKQKNAEFTTISSSNISYSIEKLQAVEQNTEEEHFQPQTSINKEGIIQFLEYLAMWINQTLQQICQLKGVLELAHSQSSINSEQETTIAPIPIQRKPKVCKKSLLTSKLQQGYLDFPKLEANFFEDKENKEGIKEIRNVPKSEMSFRSGKRHDKNAPRMSLGTLSLNKELMARNSKQNCNCQIY